MEKNKKKKYILIALAVAILTYFNYFREERIVEIKERVIETLGVTYKDGDYIIDAGKQSDFLDKNETIFENAKAQIRDMLLTSDNAFLDKARNLVLKSNILGIAPNGWSFTANDISYDRELGKIVSRTGVRAENKERGLVLLSDEFFTDSKMSFIDLYKNVTIIGDRFTVIGDEAHYTDSDKIAIVKNNIKLAVKNAVDKTQESSNKEKKQTTQETSNEEKKQTAELTGEFSTIRFDVEKGIITSDEEYTLNYGEVELKAEKFIFNQKDNSGKIYQNIRLIAGDFNVSFDRIEKLPNEELINIVGPIIGNSPDRSFVADRGVYSSERKELTLIGNIKVKGENGESLLADKIIYNIETQDLFAYGENRDVVYTTVNEKFESKKIHYNLETKILVIDDQVKFSNKTYNGTAESLIYNELTKEGEFRGIKVSSSENIIDTPVVLYKGQEGNIILPENYTVTQINRGGVFSSKNSTYNEQTKIFTTEEEFTYVSKGDVLTGKGIVYNVETQTGATLSKIEIINKEKGTVLRGNKGEIKNGEVLSVSGDVFIQSREYITEVSKVDYTFKDKLVKIEEAVKIKSLDGKTVIDLVNPIINLEKNILTGTKFVGVSENYKGESEQVEYRYEEGVLILKENARLEQGDVVVTGNRIEYSLDIEKIEAKGAYTAKNAVWTVNGVNLSIVNSTGAIRGGRINATSVKNERFQGDRVEGNLNTKVSFIGNTRGQSYGSDGRIVTYTGDRIDASFKKNPNGQGHQATRIDLLKNSVLTSENITLYSNNISIDLVKNTALASGRPRVIVKDAGNGDTEILADRMDFNFTEELIKLFGNIIITNTNEKNEVIVAKGNNGTVRLKEKLVELQGDVTVDSPRAILYSDRAEYDTTTKKIRAFGNTKIDYKKQ